MKRLIKQLKMRWAIRRHLAKYGGFNFKGHPIKVPQNLKLSLKNKIARETYEVAEAALIERYLQTDIPVIELGGCIGLISSFVASKLEPDVALLIVEANPALIDICRHNASLGGKRPNTRVISKAIAYGHKTVSISITDNIHVSRVNHGDPYQGITVDATTLAQLVKLVGSPPAYTLVCDIEGAEIDLLRNDIAALENCRLAILELHPQSYQRTGHSVENLLDFAKAAGLSPIAQDGDVYAFAQLDVRSR